MSSITYQPGTIYSLIDGGAPHEDFHMLRDGQPTGLGYFLDPAPNRVSNSFRVQVDGGKALHVAIQRMSDDEDWYVLVHVPSGMTFPSLFRTEAHVKQHAEALLALGFDWTQPVEVLQEHPLWKDLGRLNKEIVARILGK